MDDPPFKPPTPPDSKLLDKVELLNGAAKKFTSASDAFGATFDLAKKDADDIGGAGGLATPDLAGRKHSWSTTYADVSGNLRDFATSLSKAATRLKNQYDQDLSQYYHDLNTYEVSVGNYQRKLDAHANSSH